MSESRIFGNGKTVTGNSMLNKDNAGLAEEYRSKMAKDEKDSLYGMAREEGIREGSNQAYMDVMRGLESSGQFNPIVEGSPEDIQMQANVDRGNNYAPPEEPGLLDSLLGKASNWLSGEAPEEQSQLQKYQEFEQMQYDSEQAGLAELKQLLNRQQ